MAEPKNYLMAGGVISTLISIFHVILTFRPALYRYIAPGQGSELAQMAELGSSLTTIATLALALIFAIWAIYAFSGAELLRPLPLQRPALIVIGVIYILRALFLPSEINMVVNQGYPFRFVVFSSISLVTGALYMIGTLKRGAPLSSGE